MPHRLVPPCAADGSGNVQVYHTDGPGTVRAIADGYGTLIQTYQTDEFGVPTQTQGSSTQPFQFTGQQRDTTGLIYLRARHYDPTTGRFVSRDPEFGNTLNPISLNRYTYARNNPLLFVDPSGRVAIEQAQALCAIEGLSCENLTHNMAVELLRGDGNEFSSFDFSALTDGSPIDKAVFVLGMVGAGGGSVRAEILGNFERYGIQVTETVASRMGTPFRFISPSVIKEAVATGRAFSDPQGAEGMIAFFTTTVRNGTEVGVKVVYDTIGQRVVHAHFGNPGQILRQIEKSGEIFVP